MTVRDMEIWLNAGKFYSLYKDSSKKDLVKIIGKLLRRFPLWIDTGNLVIESRLRILDRRL